MRKPFAFRLGEVVRKPFAFSLGEVVAVPGQETKAERKADKSFRVDRVVFNRAFEGGSFVLLRNNEPYFGQTFNTPAELVEGFDFTVCQAGVWWDGDQMRSTAAPSFYKDLEQKKLVYATLGRDDDRGSALLRVLKFYQRGYRITLPSLSRVLAQLVNEPKSSIGSLRGCAAGFEFLLRSRVDSSTELDQVPYSLDAD